MFSLISLWLASITPAHADSSALFNSPALLVDYNEYGSVSGRFNSTGSETRALRDLVEILYDFDNGRPWGSGYFPEANARLKDFRATVCRSLPVLSACFRPAYLWSGTEIVALQKAVLDPYSLAAIAKHYGLSVRPWPLPFRPDAFSVVIGQESQPEPESVSYWGLSARPVDWIPLRLPLVTDKDNYRAGFEQKDFPALIAYSGNSMAINDWLLRHRTMLFASDWKHAIDSRRRWDPKNPIVEAKERLFAGLRDDSAAELDALYASLLTKVSGAHKERFEKERSEGGYPEEVYQHLAYGKLNSLLRVQGSYLAAAKARKGQSPRQQALEALLTVQRYIPNPRFFAMEALTMIEPITSHCFVLDAAADAGLTQALILEQLKAILGMDNYAGKTLFPAAGKGIIDAELFRDTYLESWAPDIKTELNGRDFLTLDTQEQLRILRLYLAPATGKVRPMALYRLAALWLTTAGDAELRQLADVVHAKRFP